MTSQHFVVLLLFSPWMGVCMCLILDLLLRGQESMPQKSNISSVNESVVLACTCDPSPFLPATD